MTPTIGQSISDQTGILKSADTIAQTKLVTMTVPIADRHSFQDLTPLSYDVDDELPKLQEFDSNQGIFVTTSIENFSAANVTTYRCSGDKSSFLFRTGSKVLRFSWPSVNLKESYPPLGDRSKKIDFKVERKTHTIAYCTAENTMVVAEPEEPSLMFRESLRLEDILIRTGWVIDDGDAV